MINHLTNLITNQVGKPGLSVACNGGRLKCDKNRILCEVTLFSNPLIPVMIVIRRSFDGEEKFDFVSQGGEDYSLVFLCIDIDNT